MGKARGGRAEGGRERQREAGPDGARAARFYIGADAIAGGAAEIAGTDARHIAGVLRMRAGDTVVLFDGAGHDYVCELTAVSERAAFVRVLERVPSRGEPAVKVWLWQAVPRSDKCDWIVQKCVEAGVVGITLIISERTQALSGLSGADGGAPHRFERWRRICYEASKQSGRGAIPDIEGPVGFDEAVVQCAARVAERPDARMALIAYEGERTATLKAALTKRNTSGILTDHSSMVSALTDHSSMVSALTDHSSMVSALTDLSNNASALAELHVFIGPEGGFSPREIERAQSGGIMPVTLGPRILRTETAGLAVVCSVMYEFET